MKRFYRDFDLHPNRSEFSTTSCVFESVGVKIRQTAKSPEDTSINHELLPV